MSKRSKVQQLAEVLGQSRDQAKAFGDAVNRILGERGHRTISFADIGHAVEAMPRAQRRPEAVAQAILDRDAAHERETAPSQPPQDRMQRGAPRERATRPTAPQPSQRPDSRQHHARPRSDSSSASPPASAQPREAMGTVTQVQPHYLAIELEGDGQANCLSSRWPVDAEPPRRGLRVWCRYDPLQYQVIEIRLVEQPPRAIGPVHKPSQEGEKADFDPDYLNERLREGHRYEIMAFLKEHGDQGHIEWYHMMEARNPRYSRPQRALKPEVLEALRDGSRGFGEFYLHQARALDAIRAGHNVLLVTQTASGKTLCYNPAIFESLATLGDGVHALYVFPLNALLMDQMVKIDGLCSHLARRGTSVSAALLKGGIPWSQRQKMASSPPNILCCNPELLSVILRDFRKGWWRPFFDGLRYLVIDEVHFYRGLLGIHMAGLVRRLMLTAQRGGGRPQLVLSSATVRNPLDLAWRLTSLPSSSFDVLGEKSDGSAQAVKHWAVYSPDAGGTDEYDGYLGAAASAMVDLLCAVDTQGRSSPLNTVLFAKSMRNVNKAYRMVVQNLEKRRPDLVPKVREFISARLDDAEKREIYEGLLNERYVGVVSTNALEAGIDIERLDACIIAGFPFTVMRMRQMAGRVGRRDEGLVLYVPHSASPVDQYYRYDPNLLLAQRPEVFVVDAENPYIMRKHLNAAAYHLGSIDWEEARIFGPNVEEMVRDAVQAGVMGDGFGRLTGTGRDYKDLDDVYAIHNMRSNVQLPYALCRSGYEPCQVSPLCFSASPGDEDRCRGRISIIDQQYVYRDVHPGAIYEAGDQGVLYRIASIDEDRRIVRAESLPEDTMERTFVDESMNVEILEQKGSRALPAGAAIAWGRVSVVRTYDGYYAYSLLPARRCRRCRIVFDDATEYCPKCGRHTETFFRQSRPEWQDFPSPHNEHGFRLSLDTIAAWLVVPPDVEDRLTSASPCKLPGEENRVLAFLREPFRLGRAMTSLQLTEDEHRILRSYHEQAGEQVHGHLDQERQSLLFPGIYGQCLLCILRQELPESRALEIFGGITGYPVTEDLRHVCRKCQTSVLYPSMHTVEHTVAMRYPSVALGDASDLGSYTTLGHIGTGAPTIFWFDNYEGGIGAAEKIYDQIQELLSASWDTIKRCSCTTIEGCPYCAQMSRCGQHNQALSKPAARELIHVLLGRPAPEEMEPFLYRQRDRQGFNRAYAKNEYVEQEHGIGAEAPSSARSQTVSPHLVLRLQNTPHEPVVHKAFEVRSSEITDEVPPISAAELQNAYREMLHGPLPEAWSLTPQMSPYEVLEILPAASTRMISRIYRLIARQLHPDANPTRQQWATEMMQIVNRAWDTVQSERR